jgi:probable rRNA maturation factor
VASQVAALCEALLSVRGEASGAVIAREARAQRKTLAAHYAHLVLHGLLHLRGYEHEKKREAERMERLEIRLLARAGFGNPYTVE